MPRIRKEPEPDQEDVHASTPPTPEPPTPPAETPPPKPVAVVQRRIETVHVSMPLGEIGPGYRSTHVQAFLDTAQAETMQRLLTGLRDLRRTTINGRQVVSAADAVRWLLEQAGA